MIKPVIMPKLGKKMKKGIISKWLKREGEKVEKGESIVEIETEKVVCVIPAENADILLKIVHPAKSEVHTGTTIAFTGKAGDTIPRDEHRIRKP